MLDELNLNGVLGPRRDVSWSCLLTALFHRAVVRTEDVTELPAPLSDGRAEPGHIGPWFIALAIQLYTLIARRTGYRHLDERIAKIATKKAALLCVLAHPAAPLHNNPSTLGSCYRVHRRDVRVDLRPRVDVADLGCRRSHHSDCGQARRQRSPLSLWSTSLTPTASLSWQTVSLNTRP